MLVIAALAIILATVWVARADQTAIYGSDGSYQGSVFTYGDRQTFVDRYGRFSGSSVTTNNGTSFFDTHGHFQGSTVHTAPAMRGGRR